jgi:hypothetical protein
MKQIVILLFIVLCFLSLITTFRAIYLISINKFNGSKAMWILISMIAFIGPVLWITKGNKLISKTVNKHIGSQNLLSVPENSSTKKLKN